MKKINILFFLLLPFIDVLTALSTRLVNLPISIGILIKGLYILVLSIYIIFYSKSKYKKGYLIYIISVLIFGLLYFITKNDLLDKAYLFTEVTYMFKAFYASILFFGLLVLYDDKKYNNNDLIKLMIYSLFIYCLLLIIPTLTHTNFDSYGIEKGNEGSIGWFYAGNDISAIILMLYPFIYEFLSRKIDKNNKKTYYYYPIIILVIASIFIIGTKTSWIGLILITLVLAIINLLKKNSNKILILIVLLLLVPVTLISPAFTNASKDVKEVTTNEPTKKVKKTTLDCKRKYLSEIVGNETITKIINTALSGRENKAYTEILLYNESSIVDKFFGIGFSNTERINDCNVTKYIEIDILDILVHYGILGLVLIFTPFIYVLKFIIDNKKNLDKNIVKYIAISTIMIIISCVAGHIIGYPSSGIYLSLYLLLITINIKEKSKLI